MMAASWSGVLQLAGRPRPGAAGGTAGRRAARLARQAWEAGLAAAAHRSPGRPAARGVRLRPVPRWPRPCGAARTTCWPGWCAAQRAAAPWSAPTPTEMGPRVPGWARQGGPAVAWPPW